MEAGIATKQVLAMEALINILVFVALVLLVLGIGNWNAMWDDLRNRPVRHDKFGEPPVPRPPMVINREVELLKVASGYYKRTGDSEAKFFASRGCLYLTALAAVLVLIGVLSSVSGVK